MSDSILRTATKALEEVYNEAWRNQIKFTAERTGYKLPEGWEELSADDTYALLLIVEMYWFEKTYGHLLGDSDVNQVYIDCFYEGTA